MRLIGKQSITWRLTLLFASASTVVLLALGFVVASSVENHFEEQDMEVLAGKMELARHALQQLKSTDELGGLQLLLENSLVGHHGLEIVVFDAKREPIFSTANANFPYDLLVAKARRSPNSPSIWKMGEQSYRGIAAQVPIGNPAGSPVMVAVATDIMHHQMFMRSFQNTLWLFVIVAATLTGFLGWAAARRGLAPLRAMREKAQGVTAQQLSHRLPVDEAPLELAELAQSLNEMLARLEDAFTRLSDFSSDIAHELRTPVSNLMTQTQVALSRARSADEYRGILESNAEEFEHMSRMISDMLLLAKAENGLAIPNQTQVQLAVEVRALFEYYDAVAEEKGLQLQLEGDGVVHADRLMLRRALGNLLSNAVRHATPQTKLRVLIDTDREATVRIRVENTGEAIAPIHWERVFDRFFRVDPSRQRSSDGSGLGLAITKSIVLAHGGQIEVSSKGELTTFSIELPALS